MRIIRLFAVAFLVLAVLGCSKKSSKPTEPGDDNRPDIKSFRMQKDTVLTKTPCFVNFMFHVTDMEGNGISWLKEEDFEVREDDRVLARTGNSISIRQKDQSPYTLKSVLLLNNSAGTDLATVKAAAKAFIQKMFAKQTAAVYSYAAGAVQVLDFTDDQTALSAAVDGITAADAADNLYAVLEGILSGLSDSYTNDFIEQNAVILFTSGSDNQGTSTIQEVLQARGRKAVLAVGIGAGVDAAALGQIGNIGFIPVAGSSEAAAKMTEAGEALSDYAQSFYWLTYMSEKRGFVDHTVKVSIASNENTGTDASVEGGFRSSYFYTAVRGLFVNYSDETKSGVSVMTIVRADTITLQALTTYATNGPEYSWSTDNDQVLIVFPDDLDDSRGYVVAVGDSSESASITVTDVANNVSATVQLTITTIEMGRIIREYWLDIGGGTALTDLTGNAAYPDNPTGRDYRTSFEAPVDWKDNYGQRLRGYLVPPGTGNYTFYIASDDLSELWLSSDNNPVNKALIAKVTTWTNSREWQKEPGNQKSAPVPLQAGRIYYIEALMKEGSGGDNVAVTWQGPGIPVVAVANMVPIAGQYLGFDPAWPKP
ncbi:VWA domain-containing protein [bacterium]|nr:VWA domain-containing protein [bacterium]